MIYLSGICYRSSNLKGRRKFDLILIDSKIYYNLIKIKYQKVNEAIKLDFSL